MRRDRLISFLLLIGSCLSCQKERDRETPSGSLLIKTVSRSGTDSTVTTYSYDSQERLIREKSIILSAGFTGELIINRNSNGTITTTVQKSPGFIAIGFDSVTTRYNYNSATSRYTSSVLDMGTPVSTIDSIVYTYDASSRIIADSLYVITVRPVPGPPVLVLRNTYSYSAAGNNLVNVLSEKLTAIGGPFVVSATHDFTYDAQVSPLILLNEAILLNRAGLIDYTNGWLLNMGNIFSGSNATKTVYANFILPSNSYTMDYQYWYNGSNMPDSSIGTKTPGGNISVRKYFYQ